MAFRDFDAARAERDREREPIRFRFASHDYRCVANPVLADVFDLLDAPDPDGVANEAAAARAIARFVDRLLVTARDRRRFARAISDRRDPVSATQLVELGEWLAEQYQPRPTGPSSDSSDGRPTGGVPSKPSPYAPAGTTSQG